MPIIEPTTTSSEGTNAPVSTTTESSLNNEVIIDNLTIGDISTTGYKFPPTLGSDNQILIANTTTKELYWGAQTGGGGDITNGGQTGTISIGSTDNGTTLLGQTGAVTVRSTNNKLTLSANAGIILEGGIEYQYDLITLNNASSNITEAYYLVEVAGSGANTVVLPEADGQPGKKFIISKGYLGGSLTISTQTADKIDGDDDFILTEKDTRISLISSGTDRWLII